MNIFSDEEEEVDEDVSLIVMKRPPITERVVEEVEVSNIFYVYYKMYH